MTDTEQVPIIDISPYTSSPPFSPTAKSVIQQIHTAAATWGFFLLTNTAIPPPTKSALVSHSHAFFDLPLPTKMSLDVSKGGPRWRGYMPLGGEHTHGGLDYKEGMYFGNEHGDDHPLVVQGMPLHGRNRFPSQEEWEGGDSEGMKGAVLGYLDAAAELGKTLTDVFSEGLFGSGEEDRKKLRGMLIEPEPVLLFRAFKYLPVAVAEGKEQGEGGGFGIGEHTGLF